MPYKTSVNNTNNIIIINNNNNNYIYFVMAEQNNRPQYRQCAYEIYKVYLESGQMEQYLIV